MMSANRRLSSFQAALALAQAMLAGRVVLRLARTARGQRVAPHAAAPAPGERISVIVPVLNEYRRLPACLDGLLRQGPEVAEILVVDGGSSDGTQALVARYAARDARVRLVAAGLAPGGWNGKAWNLQAGLCQSARASSWVLTMDADVRPSPLLARSLLAHARHVGVPAFSIATLQLLSGTGEGLLHPALLATLVYRLGIPGQASRRVRAVQANGQCFFARRAALEAIGGFQAARDSICEDVTLARALARRGFPVGFYEAGELAQAKMYTDWRETWRGWTRSLPLRDRFSGLAGFVGLLEVALVQALPLPLVLGLRVARWPVPRLMAINSALLAVRLGVLVGMRRAYQRRPWSYWLSPLADVPVALQLWRSALRREHVWRGRVVVRGV